MAATAAIALMLATGVSAQSRRQPGPAKVPMDGLTWGELALLPEYCMDAQGIVYGDQYFNPSPRAAYWVSRMGQGFWAIHHYCHALANVRKAEAAGVSPAKRKFMYERAIQDYLYTLNNSAPDMALVPEILVRLGEAYFKVGNLGEALVSFEKSRRAKPDYAPAYSGWVDILVSLKMQKEAKAMAEQGLAHVPGSEVLRRQFKSLGGDPGKVAVIAPAASAAASSADDAASSPPPAASQAD